MENDVKNLYHYLCNDSMKGARLGWYKNYVKIVENIQKLRLQLLQTQSDLMDEKVFVETGFASKDDFIKQMFANTGNGVSSNGQSIFSNTSFNQVTNDIDFLTALANLVKDPNKKNHDDFAQVWFKKIGQNNPVQTNRATAACTTWVSSTVDNGKFHAVFEWFQQHRYIPSYNGENNWYDKNIFLIENITKVLKDEKGVDPYWINILVWTAYENLATPFSLKKQLVKYGAPGTGKTYQAKETSKLQFNIWKGRFTTCNLKFEDVVETVQFHPSYSYEDFMEGLRPILDSNNQAQLQLQNGVFKKFCIQAGRWEVDVHSLGLDKSWNELTVNDLMANQNQLTGEHWKYIFDNDNKYIKLHEIIPPHFIIIDEINRAELSRVFGELMLCLEYRGAGESIKTQYNELNTAKTGMIKIAHGYKFFIPHNVYVLATMNTIDRSVESFDFALRRRFKWEEVKPDIDLLRYHLESYNSKWKQLADNLKNLNKAIIQEPVLSKDYCIGHAYLWKLPYSKELSVSEVRERIWDDSIVSLLEEYLRGTGKSETLSTFKKAFGI